MVSATPRFVGNLAMERELGIPVVPEFEVRLIVSGKIKLVLFD